VFEPTLHRGARSIEDAFDHLEQPDTVNDKIVRFLN
jgi:hypothetical protein